MKIYPKKKMVLRLVIILFIMFAAATISTIAMASSLESPGKSQSPLRRLMDAICIVESGCDHTKTGDDGNAIGPYQIWEPYWFDATEHDPSIGGSYLDCYNKDYSEKVVLAYWDRYATQSRLGHQPTDEDRSRIHNGGPNGHKKPSTAKYWTKVKNQLDG
jgi:hypothetical protein